jgi:hypothetical protein
MVAMFRNYLQKLYRRLDGDRNYIGYGKKEGIFGKEK